MLRVRWRERVLRARCQWCCCFSFYLTTTLPLLPVVARQAQNSGGADAAVNALNNQDPGSDTLDLSSTNQVSPG